MIEKYQSAGELPNWGPEYVSIHAQTLEKLAGLCHTPQALVDVMEKLRPRPEGRYILLNALGAYEYWGFNKNGDAFPEWSLKGEHPPKSVIEIINKKVLDKIPGFSFQQANYGYKTFVTDANVFEGHRNQDPSASIGDVIASAYNEKMHRVELIIFVYKDRNPELVQKIDDGEPVPFSMGARLKFDTCLLPGSLINTPEGYTKAEDVEVGDSVFTQQGNVRKVTKLFRTPGDHDVRSVKVGGIGDPLEVTHNHPILVLKESDLSGCVGATNTDPKKRHRFISGVCRHCEVTARDVESRAYFIPADEIAPGDFVSVPVVSRENDEELSPELAYVIGLYLGGGNLLFSKSERYGDKAFGVNIWCQDDQEYTDYVQTALEAVSSETVYKYPDGCSRKAWQIQTYDPALVTYLYGACGVKKDKHLPAQIWSSSSEAKRALLAGLLDSDGSVKSNGSGSFASTLHALYAGFQLLAASCGLAADYTTEEKQTPYGAVNYGRLNLGKGIISELAEFSLKAQRVFSESTRISWSTKIISTPAGNWHSVDSVTCGEYTGTVYNFSVEDDETYLVNNVAVHNCSICLNCARTRAEYCDHLRYQLGNTLPDGRKVFAYNFFGRFFDISYVRVPADRSAWQLKKIARYESQIAVPRRLNNDKLAELVKNDEGSVGTNLGSSPINKKLLDFLMAHAKQKYNCTDEDPNLLRAVKGFKLKEILASLSSMGVLLRPREVTKLAGSDGLSITSGFSTKDINLNLVRKLAQVVESRSFYDPHFSKQASPVGSVEPLEDTDGSFNSYRKYLQTIDLKKLAAWLETSPEAKITIDSESCMFKIAGAQRAESETPFWLPFFSSVLRFNELI